ncbi:MAG: hypothetical protein WDA16_01530 [Candidatus Thermoplasmatota archaeon]
MTRVVVLRLGYAAYGLAFVALAASAYAGTLVLVAFAVAFLAAIFLAASRDDLPRWAGIALLAYFIVTVGAFLLQTPITIRSGGRYHIDAAAPALASAVFDYLAQTSPLMLGGAALAAAWERERPARILLLGGLAGFIVVGLLTFILVPHGSDLSAVKAAQGQANLLLTLGALSAIAAAAGAFWSAVRPEESS